MKNSKSKNKKNSVKSTTIEKNNTKKVQKDSNKKKSIDTEIKQNHGNDKKSFISKLLCFLNVYKYSFVIFAIFLVALLAYWPGILVSDSVVQWDQIKTGAIDNWHPAYNTIYIMLLSKIWDTPGFVLLVQSLIMSLCIGGFIYRFEKYYKVNKIFLFICSILIAILPINFNSAVTLLKDSLYSVFIILLASYSLDMFNNEDFFTKKINLIKLFISLLLIMLFRHNGILTVGLYFICLLFFYYKKKWLYIIFISSIGIYFLLTTVGFRVLNIEQNNYANKYGPISHIYARILNEHPEYLSDRDLEYLSVFVDVDKLKQTYNPVNMDYSINSQNMDVLKEKGNDYLKFAISKFARHPFIVIKHYYYLDSFLFSPIPFKDSSFCGMFVETDLWIFKDVYPELNEDSKIKSLLPFLKQYTKSYQELKLGNWTMRPPLYMYLSIIITIYLAFKFKNKKIVLLSALSVCNIVGLSIAMPVPMTRYVYSTILLGQILILIGVYELFLLAINKIKERKNEK